MFLYVFSANLIQLGVSEMEGLVENTDAFMVSGFPDRKLLLFKDCKCANDILLKLKPFFPQSVIFLNLLYVAA